MNGTVIFVVVETTEGRELALDLNFISSIQYVTSGERDALLVTMKNGNQHYILGTMGDFFEGAHSARREYGERAQ